MVGTIELLIEGLKQGNVTKETAVSCLDEEAAKELEKTTTTEELIEKLSQLKEEKTKEEIARALKTDKETVELLVDVLVKRVGLSREEAVKKLYNLVSEE